MTKVNEATIALIKEFEGFEAEAYLCPGGVWTIGYGITAGAGIGVSPRRGMTVTREQADFHLREAVDKFAAGIRPAITAPINENQFGAFASLAYNIGPAAFRRSSALRRFNEGDVAGAADAILMWNKADGQVLRGLERRRKAERKMFLTPVAAPALAPRPASGLAAFIARLVSAIFGRGAK
jgi:lysozyme